MDDLYYVFCFEGERKLVVTFILAVLSLVALDQFSKYKAVVHLKEMRTFPIIQNVFHFTYVENEGAAFGILQNKRLFFIMITLVVLLGISYYYLKMPKKKPYNRIRLCLILIFSGALGNLIDRIRLGYVVDFFDFRLINFPVFNVADVCVVIGTIFLSLLILFLTEDEMEVGKTKIEKAADTHKEELFKDEIKMISGDEKQ